MGVMHFGYILCSCLLSQFQYHMRRLGQFSFHCGTKHIGTYFRNLFGFRTRPISRLLSQLTSPIGGKKSDSTPKTTRALLTSVVKLL